MKYLGPIFTLLLALSAVAAGIFFLTKGILMAAVTMALMAAIAGYIVVVRDWPRTWKPLL